MFGGNRVDTLEWDEVLGRIFDVPLDILPRIVPSDGGFGTVAPGLTALPEGTRIQAMLGDSHAALFAHGIRDSGGIKVTIGTGSSLMAATPVRVRSSHGLSSTIAWCRAEGGAQHALEGNISVSGHAVAFATALLGLPDEAAFTRLAAEVEDSDGVVFVPALGGLGAPHWRAGARGTISGMTLGTRRAHIARATLEAIALQIGDVLDAVEADLGTIPPALSIDGGAARNPMLAQMLSDLLGRTIVRSAIAEASALGVARLAAEALGIATPAPAAAAERIDPAMPAERRDTIRARWRKAVSAVIAQAEERIG